MACKQRINSKTGKKEYKVRYYFYTGGKKRDSETGWFATEAEARNEADRLKKVKEREDAIHNMERRDKRIVVIKDEYLEELKKDLTTTTQKEYYFQTANLFKNHTTEEVLNMKIRDITPIMFRDWLSEINKKPEVGGHAVRMLKLMMNKFNIWLAENRYYLEDDFDMAVEIAIGRVKIKPKSSNNKEKAGIRNIITIVDINRLCRYFIDNGGLGNFYNFYHYTLFYTLFFSGMRVEELIGLQWKFIDLRPEHRSINILNAITELETESIALERVANRNYLVKNEGSIRTIPIFDFYYQLLLDYKESYRYQFGLTKEELEECYVFPRVNELKMRLDRYQRAEQLRIVLRKVSEAIGLAKTDLQMFRHSCATFLIMPAPNGLGFSEEKVKDYFGHQDTQMLTQIYARLNKLQKAERLKNTFSEIYRPEADKAKQAEEELKRYLISQIYDNEKSAAKARKFRIKAQIEEGIKKGRNTYYYNERDKGIIEELREEFINSPIQFLLDTE